MSARIPIIDDVPANARLLDAKLSVEYYQVRIARDGFEGLELARSWQPDLILLDVMMPGMDADDFLTKPVHHPTLTVRVRSLIRLKHLLDECRARSETGRALGLGGGALAVPTVADARPLDVNETPRARATRSGENSTRSGCAPTWGKF